MLALDALILQTLSLESSRKDVISVMYLKTIISLPNDKVSNVLMYLLPFLNNSEKNTIKLKVHTLCVLDETQDPDWLSLLN